MAVRVRLFAALREAAGTGEAEVEPGPLPVVLDALSTRYGDQFAKVLSISSVLVDGSPAARDPEVEVPDGAEVALLPPVSGGAGRAEDDLPPRSSNGPEPPSEPVDEAGSSPGRLLRGQPPVWEPWPPSPARSEPPGPGGEGPPTDGEPRDETMDFPLPPEPPPVPTAPPPEPPPATTAPSTSEHEEPDLGCAEAEDPPGDGEVRTVKLRIEPGAAQAEGDDEVRTGKLGTQPSRSTGKLGPWRRVRQWRRRDRQTIRGGRVRARLALAARALPKDPIAAAALPVALTMAGLAGLLGGRDAFVFVVLAGSVLALIDLVVLMDRGARPLLPIAAIPWLVLPAVLAFDASVGWDVMTSLMVVALLAAFGFMLVGGSCRGAADGLGLTLLAGLLVGLGTSALILLSSLPGGLRAAGILVALVVVADLAAVIARLGAAPPHVMAAAPALGAALPALILVIVGGTPLIVLALLVLAAAAGVRYGRALTAALRREGRREPRAWLLLRGLLGDGLIFSATDALLLAAPVAYVVVRLAG